MANCIICAEFDNCPWRAEPNAMCSRYRQRKMTNADRIRAMLDEELAEWLAEILFHCSNTICDQRCPMYECCCDQPSDNIEDWLKQEAKE